MNEDDSIRDRSADPRTFARHPVTKAPDYAIAGVGCGALAGGALGLLVGLSFIALPGLGLLLAAGPFAAALAGALVGGCVGGVVGALLGRRIPYDGVDAAHDAHA